VPSPAAGSPRIATAGRTRCVRWLTLAENDADQVVGAGGVIALLHCGSDLVVGLGHHLRGGNSLQVVAKSTKRKDVCHGKLLIVTS